jgi:uncharacterized protein
LKTADHESLTPINALAIGPTHCHIEARAGAQMNSTVGGAAGNLDSQAEVVRFLSEPQSYGLAGGTITFIETHGARVFLAGDLAYKIKRAVRFDYMDFSTLALRRAACERELEINRSFAPQLYCGLVPITRGINGQLAFGGTGVVVEWAVRMRRFDQDRLLGAIAKAGPLDAGLCETIGDLLVRHHQGAPIRTGTASGDRLQEIAVSVATTLTGARETLGADETDDFDRRIRAEFDSVKGLVADREAAGFVRRCHGDMHLDNIVLLDDGPVLFDAIEFSEEIATVDVLYDLAFLLMDLCHVGQQRAANRILNRYVWCDGSRDVLDGLATLPLYQALRAGVRAMVLVQRFDQSGAPEAARRASAYLATALRLLRPDPPRLFAVGGFSGTGKTTQARALAPLVGRMPGAVHVRSDLERKRLFGVAETERLPAEAYATEANATVYERMLEKAERILCAGWSVVLDAVWGRDDERAAAEAVARRCGVRFDGIWLRAHSDVMVRRVSERSGDASDATPEVVRAQVQRGAGALGWPVVDSGGTRDEVLARVRALPGLGLEPVGDDTGQPGDP